MKHMALIVAVAMTGSTFQEDSGSSDRKYYFGHDEKYVNITFESHADLETIVGTTHSASGELRSNLAQGTGSVFISVPVESLRTGIEARDEHLRQPNWLDAETFPNITFRSKRVMPVPGKMDQLQVVGDLSIHGVKREIVTPVIYKLVSREATRKAGFGNGEWVKFATEFDVALSDYGVRIPSGIVAKVSDVWKVRMVLFAGTEKPE